MRTVHCTLINHYDIVCYVRVFYSALLFFNRKTVSPREKVNGLRCILVTNVNNLLKKNIYLKSRPLGGLQSLRGWNEIRVGYIFFFFTSLNRWCFFFFSIKTIYTFNITDHFTCPTHTRNNYMVRKNLNKRSYDYYNIL